MNYIAAEPAFQKKQFSWRREYQGQGFCLAAVQMRLNDGGIETWIIYGKNETLPHFSCMALPEERLLALLREYFAEYIDLSQQFDIPLVLETPTWRSSRGWLQKIGLDAESAQSKTKTVVKLMKEMALPSTIISGCIGPRGDGYVAGEAMSLEESRVYHREQIELLKECGVDQISLWTMTNEYEAAGAALAAQDVAIPISVGFTVETNGLLPNGISLADGMRFVLKYAQPAYFALNCCHPDHMRKALEGLEPELKTKIGGLKPNASRLSHEELDNCETLDDGDPEDLSKCTKELAAWLGNVQLLGGCCGTDVRHIRAMFSKPN